MSDSKQVKCWDCIYEWRCDWSKNHSGDCAEFKKDNITIEITMGAEQDG